MLLLGTGLPGSGIGRKPGFSHLDRGCGIPVDKNVNSLIMRTLLKICGRSGIPEERDLGAVVSCEGGGSLHAPAQRGQI
jgi:hypothetical protein